MKLSQLQLEAELKARDEFFSAVAHELRNPLNALHLTMAGLIRSQSGPTPLAPEQVVARVNRASMQVARMARIVDDMLDVSRISAGRLQLQLEDFDASPVLAEVVARMKDDAAPAIISLSMPPSLPIRCDRTRFAQIASNLLSNAILYGNQAPIEVRLEPDDATVRLTVADHGIGIADGDQERIFERFEKLSTEKPNVRFGVGLWVAREVIRALKGAIRVASKLGEGSTFLVELPKLHSVGAPPPSE
jgi:signal transduction histidine kinase